MAEFFTGRGDDGTTGLLGPERIPKHHPRAEAMGAVDEAAAALGLARALLTDESLRSTLLDAQRDLYHLMAEVAAPGEAAGRFRVIDAARVAWLEDEIRRLSHGLRVPSGFVVGGDSPPGGALDLARTVVRRAERRLAGLVDDGQVENVQLLRYLNRLSSLCFVMILAEYQRSGIDPTPARR